MKRKPRIVPNKDEFYLGLAFWMAAKSKDPDSQMGAVIISAENTPLGWGYNGPPADIDDNEVDWNRPSPEDPDGPSKYDWMEHAEENAIDFCSGSAHGATIYVTAKPCKRCMRKIVKKKIKRVVYFPYKPTDPNSMFNKEKDTFSMSDKIAKKGGVQLVEFKGKLSWIKDQIFLMEKIGVFG